MKAQWGITLCRVNGMRIAGGQEIGMACDITVASDLALFGQAGPKHGSAPDGGSTDFLPWFLPIENALWNCISCELWSAYKMQLRGVIRKAVPVLMGPGQAPPNRHWLAANMSGEAFLGFGAF